MLVENLIKELKKLPKDVVIVCGGTHITHIEDYKLFKSKEHFLSEVL